MPNSSRSASRVQIASLRKPVTLLTAFIIGGSNLSRHPAFSHPVIASAWRSPAARSLSTIAIPARTCRPAAPTPGTGSARRKSSITPAGIPPRSICPRWRRQNECLYCAGFFDGVMISDSNVPQIEFQKVTKSYGPGRLVLQSIDLKILKDEFVSLIGPSGCGKSTLLKLIAGLTQPSVGTIRVDGRMPQNTRKTMSFIFQDATLLPWRTVTQNVGLGLELERVISQRRKERIASLLALVGLGEVADAYPRELSGGMKMRVSIARALATHPRLLLMDEPFAALDEMTRDRLNEELLRLRSEQRWTAVFVTHSVAEAVFLSTRIMALAPNPGRIYAVVPVALPFPRTAELRECPEFETLVARASHILREALLQWRG